MAVSWYLAADMQLFIISPLFVYPLWRWRRAGVVWITFAILTIIVAISTISVVWLLSATLIDLERPYYYYFLNLNLNNKILTANLFFPIRIESNNSLYPSYYLQTWARLPQYLTGILLGWLILQTKNLQLHRVL